jgi:hypothetical protein
VTVEQLTYVLFGNPINPQDKGVIGTMQDQVKQLVRLAWALLLTFIGAMLTAGADLVVHFHP